jgi:hypothetical protein
MNDHFPVIRVRADNGLLVARDGLILCFFMRHSHAEVAPAVWRALQTYRRAIPAHALQVYVAQEGGAFPLDDALWVQVREELLEQSVRSFYSLQLQESAQGAGGYNFEYDGRRLDAPAFVRDENSTCAVSFTLPTEYLMEHGPAHIRALALELARELPLCFGYVSLALVTPTLDWFAARRAVREWRDRYLGLDIAHLEQTSRVLGTRARGAYWLTFLGPSLSGPFGGPEGLRQWLTFPGSSVQSLDGGRVLLTLSEWPELIDTTQQERPSPQLLALARRLEPVLYEEEVTGWFFQDPEEGRADMRRWIRRLCP